MNTIIQAVRLLHCSKKTLYRKAVFPKKAKQLERPLASPQQQGCEEKGGDKWGPGHAGAGKRPCLFRWQRTGFPLAADGDDIGSGRCQ